MSFFEHYFNITAGTNEVAVCCPFVHHTAGSGLPYKETNASAHINITKEVFHCKVCGEGHNIQSLIHHVLGTNYINAKRLTSIFETTETIIDWDELQLSDDYRAMAHSYGITDTVINDLNIKSVNNTSLDFPVFMYDALLDIRKYTPTNKIKVKSRTGAIAGLILPFDIWRASPKTNPTYICAGEKDMAVARSNGFNSITITGGEGTLPIMYEEFKDRDVVILYDNDDAGKNGAIKLAIALQKYCTSIRVVNGFHEVCVGIKEDITDFFTKYGKTAQDLRKYIQDTPEFEIPEDYLAKSRPLLSLHDAAKPKYINRVVRSNIQVVATSEATYTLPTEIMAEKYAKNDGDRGKMNFKDIRTWELDDLHIKDALQLMDNNFTETAIDRNIRGLLRIRQDELSIKVSKLATATVYKASVTDMFETHDKVTASMEFVAYSIGCKLESGRKYLATYKLIPHPYKGQQLTMIIIDAEQANDTVSKFEVDDTTKELLSAFHVGTDVASNIHVIVNRVKGLLGYNGNDTLIKTIDLTYHTPLYFHLGTFKNQRAYLDVIVVSESRVGKSSTVDALRKAYGLGTFTSLAGNSATIAGLIGGSNKVSGGGYQTRAGIIPQNHKGFIIFEEFGKCDSNIVRELTDIRSSNEVRITRVSGTLTLPAMVRMLALSNVKPTGTISKPIASYPNGISVIAELVTTAEDIARYDLMLVLGDKGNSNIDPFWKPLEPFTEDQYRARVRWVWSRTADQIIISNEVGRYIIDQANALNDTYNSHIKIFGTEAWKKLSRLAIAIAGYVVSTDITYENIIVTKEHIDYAVGMFLELYDNQTFRLKEYVVHERRYSSIDDKSISLLQDLYVTAPGMLQLLEQESKTNRHMLVSASGLDNNKYNLIMNRLIRGMFIKLSNTDILPTERFRLGMAKINRTVHVQEVGEEDVTLDRSGY